MAGILQRAIQVLDRLYNFPGGTRGLNEFDLAGPIQPVHDLSRMAEFGARGAADNGYLYLGQALENATAGAATIFAATDVYAAFEAFTDRQFRQADHTLWLARLFGDLEQVGSSNWTSAASGVIFPDTRTLLLAEWAADRSPIASAGRRPLARLTTTPPLYRPLFFPTGSTWNTSSLSTDDNIMRAHSIWWAGPIGVTPPGMS